MRTKFLLLTMLTLLLFVPLGLAQMREPVDLDAVYKIKNEGLKRSQVMDTLSYLTDIHGPRLTNSPNMRKAAEWAEGQLGEWGMENVHREAWPFGMGWSNERFVAHVISPQRYPLIGVPLAWTPGTKGVVKGEAIYAPFRREGKEEYFEEYKGQLKGKIVLLSKLREFKPPFKAQARRWTDEELTGLEEQRVRSAPEADFRFRNRKRLEQQAKARAEAKDKTKAKTRWEFYEEEGVLAVVSMSSWDAGILRVGGGGSRQPDKPRGPARFMLSAEHYGRIVRTLEREIPVEMEIDIKNTFHKKDLDSFNIIAEIPGTDKSDEVVMLGAHFDSWHGGTGATDNGTGSAVMMEAMRILQASGLPMRRTVRLGLWTGEEQGLLGSRAYVKEHFADRKTMELKAEHEKFSVYFNIDYGGGKIRGIYMEENEAAAPVLRAWLKLFRNMGVTTQAIRNIGGTDHRTFDAVGLPGFQFIQDPMDYFTRTHHSSMDTYERAVASDLKQVAVIVATFAYHAANREQRFPRKPLPKPRPPQEGRRQ